VTVRKAGVIGLAVVGLLAVSAIVVWWRLNPAPTKATFDRRAELVRSELNRSGIGVDTYIVYCVDDSPPILRVRVEEAEAQATLEAFVSSRWVLDPPHPSNDLRTYRHDFGPWEAVMFVGGDGAQLGASVTLDEGQQTGCSI
jgi:hypothetical protein